MAKAKASVSSTESSTSSDEVDDLNVGQFQKEINKFPLSSQKQILTSNLGKRKREGSISDSEVEYPNKKTVREVTENLPSKLNKKLKKRRKGEVSSDENTSREDVNNTSLNSADKSSLDKTRMKLKKNEKRKIVGTHDLSKKDRSVVKEKNETSESDSPFNKLTKKNTFKQKSFLNIKEEVVTDDAEPSPESDSDRNNNGASQSKMMSEVIIKKEVETSSGSDSDDEHETSGAYESRAKNSNKDNLSVTVLQDIRLTPKSKTNPKDRLKEMYPGLKPIEISTELELSDSDEIHLFRMPKNVDPKLLKNVKIDLENECKVDLGEKYSITPTVKIPNPTLLVYGNSRVLQFKNNIKMEKYIKSKTEPHIAIPEKTSVPLPDNLKKRHPLFGSDFQQKIRLSDHVEKKLDEAIANLLKRERKSKKKKDKKKKRENTEEKPNEDILNLFNPHNFMTNCDGIKKETSDDSAFGSSSSTDKLRSKKKTKEHVLDKNVEEETEVPVENETRKEKKKKMKHSHNHNEMNVTGIKEENPDINIVKTEGEVVTPSKKKKKNSSVVNSTLMSDVLRTPTFNSEISTIVLEASTSRKKSKKSKKDTSYNERSIKEELISELVSDVATEIHASKKIKMEF